MAGSLAMKYFSNGKMIVSSPFENGDIYIYIYTIDYNIYIYIYIYNGDKMGNPFSSCRKILML